MVAAARIDDMTEETADRRSAYGQDKAAEIALFDGRPLAAADQAADIALTAAGLDNDSGRVGICDRTLRQTSDQAAHA